MRPSQPLETMTPSRRRQAALSEIARLTLADAAPDELCAPISQTLVAALDAGYVAIYACAAERDSASPLAAH